MKGVMEIRSHTRAGRAETKMCETFFTLSLLLFLVILFRLLAVDDATRDDVSMENWVRNGDVCNRLSIHFTSLSEMPSKRMINKIESFIFGKA